jgi:hypothetical protein
VAAYTLSVDAFDAINKTTVGTAVDSVVISAPSDVYQTWDIFFLNRGTVDAWVCGIALGVNTPGSLFDPTAAGDGCHLVRAGESYHFHKDQSKFFIGKVLSTSGNLDYSWELMDEVPEVEG